MTEKPKDFEDWYTDVFGGHLAEEQASYELRVAYDYYVENAELTRKLEYRNCVDCSNHYSNIRFFKAKELLKRFIETSSPIYFEEDRQKVKAQAEQFLKECK